MGPPFHYIYRVIETLSALAGIGVAISILLVSVDYLNHSAPSIAHLTALVIFAVVAIIAGLACRKASPWFEWLAYGVMVGSAALGLPLIASIAFTGKLPNDLNYLGVLVVTVLLFVCALPAVLIARKQARVSDNAI